MIYMHKTAGNCAWVSAGHRVFVGAGGRRRDDWSEAIFQDGERKYQTTQSEQGQSARLLRTGYFPVGHLCHLLLSDSLQLASDRCLQTCPETSQYCLSERRLFQAIDRSGEESLWIVHRQNHRTRSRRFRCRRRLGRNLFRNARTVKKTLPILNQNSRCQSLAFAMSKSSLCTLSNPWLMYCI